MTADFDPKAYWEKRLTLAYGFQGVGYLSLGLSYNRWLYRLRKHVFRRTARQIIASHPSGKILDIGSGTGFYIDQWKELGMKRITGSDFTETAVSHLKARHPGSEFYVLDIGGDQTIWQGGSFDMISAMDVLFHIVDDARYERAIKNIHALLKPGGWFLWTENFLRNGREIYAPHEVYRSLETIGKILQSAGFEIVSRRPMFWLMNAPVDSTNLLLGLWWKSLEKIIRFHNLIGNLLGALLFPLEFALVKMMPESPTTEIMVCRRRPAGS